MKLILASGSPRRSELLAREGIAFTIIPAEVEELKGGSLPAEELALTNASLKARDVAQSHQNDLIMGADTIVVVEGQVLGKPRDLDEGAQMLRILSGKWHEVITGVALVSGGKESLFAETTRVRFQILSEKDILDYHERVHVLDKAGGYAIQDGGDCIIAEVEGCRDNVMGLPVQRVIESLKNLQNS